MVDDERKDKRMEPENIKEILSVVSSEVPGANKKRIGIGLFRRSGKEHGQGCGGVLQATERGRAARTGGGENDRRLHANLHQYWRNA